MHHTHKEIQDAIERLKPDANCLRKTVRAEDLRTLISAAQSILDKGEAKQMTVDQIMTFMKEHIRIDMSVAIGGMGTSQVLNDEGYRRIATALYEAVYGSNK